MKTTAVKTDLRMRRNVEVSPFRVCVRWRLEFFALVSIMLLGACAIPGNRLIEGGRLREVEPSQAILEATQNGEALSLPAAASSPASLHQLPLGLLLRDISHEELETLRIGYGISVMVAVGASATAGVREGDIVLSINKNRVQNVEQFWIWMDMHQWQGTLLIWRGETTIEVEIHDHGMAAISARYLDEK